MASSGSTSPKAGSRLYKDLVGSIIAELEAGAYPVGARLPAERELALKYDVSRPTVREAIIALEAQGLIEVRVGSGAYVRRLPGRRLGQISKLVCAGTLKSAKSEEHVA